MRYIIYGAGAIGGAIGGTLVQRKHEVVLIARGEHLLALRRRGLTLQTPEESVTLPVRAAAHPAEIRFREGDVVLLTMKTQHTAAALAELRSAAGGDGVPVVCAQNGVENERLALRHFERVYSMLVNLPASHLEPGVVQAFGSPVRGVLDLGRYPQGVDEVVTAIAADLERVGFRSQAHEDILRWKHAKLLSNLGNALQAACGPEAEAPDIEERLVQEALDCYRAAGIAWADEEEMLERYGSLRLAPVGGKRREGGSSWQSLARGSGSIETDYLNGEIALLGRLHGVPTPANRMLQEVAGRLARQRRPPGSVTPEELRQALPD
jgi:2-dehydropantoate 2-reductase